MSYLKVTKNNTNYRFSLMPANDTFDETATGANPSATKSRKLSLLWTYIQSKIGMTFEIV